MTLKPCPTFCRGCDYCRQEYGFGEPEHQITGWLQLDERFARLERKLDELIEAVRRAGRV